MVAAIRRKLERDWGLTPDLVWLVVAQGLWGLGFGLYGMLFPLYVEKLGGGPVVLGFLSTLAGVATALVVLPGGRLADLIDRRRIVVWGWWVAVPVPLIFALAPRWQWLLAGILLYFGSAFSTPALQAIVVDEVAPDKLAIAYNVVMGVFGAGMVIGPTVGGYLAQHVSYAAVFGISAGLYALSSWAVMQMAPHPPRVRASVARTRQWRPKMRPRFFQWMLFSASLALVQGIVWPFVVPYWKTVGHLSVQTIGELGSLAMLAATVSGPFWGRVGDRVGIPRAMGLGLGLLAAGWLALLWNPSSVRWGMASSVLRGLGEGSRGLQGVAMGRVVRPTEAGTAYGLFNLATELAGAVAPLPGGLLYAHWAYAPLVVGTFLTALVAWWLYDGLPGRPTPVPPALL